MADRGYRLHPCVCGHETRTIWQMFDHHKKCAKWLDRPDPRALQAWRARFRGEVHHQTCPSCRRLRIDHAPDCLQGQVAQARANMIKASGIPPRIFLAFLRALDRRYPHGVGVGGGPAKSPEEAMFPLPNKRLP